MSDVKVQRRVTMTRQDAARWIAGLARSLDGDGPVHLELAGSTVQVRVPERVRCEAEVEIDGDEVEIEFELKWSMAHPEGAGSHVDGAHPQVPGPPARP
jgi:amphi-Trp domain-containing protein